MNYQENPFVFGKAVDGNYFTDRREEAERLSANLTHGINTVLISPRRWGKTSLVKRVIDSNTRTDVKFVYLDVFAPVPGIFVGKVTLRSQSAGIFSSR